MSMSTTQSPLIRCMLKASIKAARGLIRDAGEVSKLQVSLKGPGDFVSSADTRAEKTLCDELADARPDFGFICEEAGTFEGEDPDTHWVIDPLDGTTNFLHGLDQFAISLAVQQRGENGKKEIIAALVNAPLLGKVYWAEKNQGAWMESVNTGSSERLRVSGRTKVSEALCAVGSLKRDHEFAATLATNTAGTRSLGSTALALCYVAAGNLDVFVETQSNLWDVAAGSLMVREAGGVFRAQKGRTLATTLKLEKAASALL